jgi:hypothetical protein
MHVFDTPVRELSRVESRDPTHDPQQNADQLIEIVTRQNYHGEFDAVTTHLNRSVASPHWSDDPVLLEALASLVVYTGGPRGHETAGTDARHEHVRRISQDRRARPLRPHRYRFNSGVVSVVSGPGGFGPPMHEKSPS